LPSKQRSRPEDVRKSRNSLGRFFPKISGAFERAQANVKRPLAAATHDKDVRGIPIEGNNRRKRGFQVRKLKIVEHISLDGVIQVSADPGEDADFPYGDWTAPYRTPAGMAIVLAIYGEHFDLLLGRRTYDLMSRFWPQAPKSLMADRLNAATKFVATHRPETLEWGPFEGVGPDIAHGVRDLKAKDGADLILFGSSTLTSALIEHGVADEVILLVDPVLIGKGKRLFAEGTPPRAFTLDSSKAMPSGIVINAYKAAGPLRNLQ
jgi:dihydrofolate reductase